jgi:hypothetical protein
MLSNTDAYFLEIKQRLNNLLVQSESLKNELETLKNEKSVLEKKLIEKEQTIENLKEKNKISKIAVGIQLSKQDLKSVKKEIDHQIREIDECIRLLNQ